MGEKGILGVFLAGCTYWDLRYRKIPFWFLLCGVFAGAAFIWIKNGICCESAQTVILGLLPGGCICFLSALVPGQIGMGDGWILMAAGAVGGWKMGIFLLEWGLICLFPAAFFWCVIKKKRNLKLPFAPFILGGYIWLILSGAAW